MSSLQVTNDSGVLYIRLRVSPGARKAMLLGTHDGALKVAVSEPPEKGRANEGVRRLLARLLGNAPTAIEITRGSLSRDKQVAIRGMTEAELRAALQGDVQHE